MTKTQKIIIISLCAVVAVAAAVAGVFGIIHMTKKATDNALSSLSYISEEIIIVDEDEIAESIPEVSSQVEQPSLVITTKKNYTTTDSIAVITGKSDPTKPLTMNGNEVTRNADGSFAVEVSLNIGKNIFTFNHDSETISCTIIYKYTVISAYYPFEAQSYPSGSTVGVVVAARPNSTVTAELYDQKITLTQVEIAENGIEFVNYTGSFTLPDNNIENIDLGKIKFSATLGSVTDVYYSPKITCLMNESLAGSAYVAEVVAHAAETFDGEASDDFSRPTNSYLPQGTLDYCYAGIVYDAESGNSYYKLKSGMRIYVDKKNAPETERVLVSKRYAGSLPDHNELSLASLSVSGKHTVMTLNTMWKAPFKVDVLPQGYTNPAKQDYTISSVTYQYVDIEFCYATVLSGDFTIPADNPIFSHSQIIDNGGSMTLRLFLKKQGMFYGWECEYNENGQLCFYFLNPAVTTAASNSYGIDLTGVTVLIDAGHGGRDIGAPGLNPSVNYEAERNLSLAYKIKAELESIGATVIMTRTDNSTLSADDRCRILRQVKPDYCIAIHHDSSVRPSANGFSSLYFSPFSKKAAEYVYNHTSNAGIYSKTSLGWHYFYLARMTTCPVVLTENGFISSSTDFAGIMDEGTNQLKATMIVQGVAEYFYSIR